MSFFLSYFFLLPVLPPASFSPLLYFARNFLELPGHVCYRFTYVHQQHLISKKKKQFHSLRNSSLFLFMLRSLTIALSENMAKNKYFLLKLNLYEKWDETASIARLISASWAKNVGDRNSLALCLFTESAGTDKQVFDFVNDLFTSST